MRTYIQSGNVFVDSEEEHGASVGFKIKQEIFKELGLEVPGGYCKRRFEACFKNNPYLKEKTVIPRNCMWFFFEKELQGSAINDLKISQFKPDEAAIDKNKIFIKYAVGAGKTKIRPKLYREEIKRCCHN